MAAIDDLIKQIEDPGLRARIAQEFHKVSKKKKFGLVFEEHLPEATPLYDIPIKRGALVAEKQGEISDIYVVTNIDAGTNTVTCVNKESNEECQFQSDDLVTVAQFGDPIYPYLKPIDTVCNAPDSALWHTLIEADNYHALQLLEYLYAGKVDCIYIDPPYNTGAKDWKYNNDYVDSSDSYRHSKWLSFMERRLKLAKKLLNPKDSVLIVTIDEKEYLHLGCLLEEMFPEARIQMVTSVINRKGVSHKGNRGISSKKEITMFSRVAEYLFFVMLGDASIRKAGHNMLDAQADEDADTNVDERVSWLSMLRRGTASHRADKPKHFYPIFVDHESASIVKVGDPLDPSADRNTIVAEDGIDIVWPMRTDGSEGRWQLKMETFKTALEEGTAKLGTYNKQQNRWAINYLNQGIKEEIESGAIIVEGKNEKGALILKRVSQKMVEPKSVWNQTSHNASEYGTSLLNSIIGSERFNYPKSLYAVMDTLDMCVNEKPEAIIVDFFAGSGTTLHAVNLLNAADDGYRRCIMVTNNEVSDDEAKELIKKGYLPGDEAWEDLGIARYVTWPRTLCTIEGQDINGEPLNGNYMGSDAPMADGFKANAAFFKLGFLDKTMVALGRQFREMLPTLWMKNGCIGPCPSLAEDDAIPDMMILHENRMAILIDEKVYSEFKDNVNQAADIDMAFIITDSEDGYREMANGLHVAETCQLYRDYLDNFRINVARR